MQRETTRESSPAECVARVLGSPRACREDGSAGAWEQLVLQRCHAINTEFAVPLPFIEVQATAKSISRWIWRNFTEADYRARQTHRGSIMSEKKREANRIRATKFDLNTALAMAAL